MNSPFRTPPTRYLAPRALAGTIALVMLLSLLALGTSRPMLAAPALSPQHNPAAPLRIVDQNGKHVANANLRLLCYDDESAIVPRTDYLYQTDATGHLVQQLPPKCPYAAVLQILHQQPSGKPGRADAYWVYNTSWAPGSRQLHATTGDIALREEWRLVLFDLQVALEWVPPASDPYAADLREGFRLASGYLYDLTDGQMAFGPYTATAGGIDWESADIRVRAANDYRPTAQAGGIVTAPINYVTPANQNPVFSPGEIWVGRYWDGFDGTDPLAGAWTTLSGHRTLVHEWLHYALFLYDEYQDANADGRVETYCTCADLPLVTADAIPAICGGTPATLAASAMAYHYTASELWYRDLPTTCTGADHYFVHGEDEWSTLTHWSAIQGVPTEWLRKPAQLNSGPELGLAGDLFGRRPTPAPSSFAIWLPLIQNSYPLPTSPASGGGAAFSLPDVGEGRGGVYEISSTTNITVSLEISPALPGFARRNLHPHLYVQEILTGTTDEVRFVHQGTTIGDRSAPGAIGQAALLGVPADGHLYATVDRYGSREGVRASFATPMDGIALTTSLTTSLTTTTVTLEPNPWPAVVDLIPGMDGPLLRTLTVTVASRVPLTVTPTVQLCSPERGCADYPTVPLTMTSQGSRWTGTFTAPPTVELPHYAILNIAAPGVGQLLRWVQMPGGVGPAHMDEHAPLRDGLATVDATAQLTQTYSRVLIMPAADSDAVLAPLPPGLDGILEQPLDIDIHLPTVAAIPNADRILTTPMILTLFHGQASLNRLGISQQQLQLLHYQRRSGRWQLVPTSGQSAALNWLATAPVTEDGIYAVGWSNIPNLGRVPTLLADRGPITATEPLRYQLLLPANPELTEPNDAFMAVGLPPGLDFANYLNCSMAGCFYDADHRVLQWQGLIGPGDLIVVSFELLLNVTPTMPCPPMVNLQAQFFDGVGAYTVQAVTQMSCKQERK